MEQYKSDIPLERARAAHRGTSFDPEKRAVMRQNDYAETIHSMRERFDRETLNDKQRKILEEELARFRQNYRTAYLKLLDSESRCMSTMITGPSNFPTRRNEKHYRWANNRRQEVVDLERKAARAISRKLEAAKTPQQIGDEETARLLREVEHCILVLVQISQGAPYAPSLFKSSLAKKLERAAQNGHQRPVQKALEHLRELQSKHLKRPAFTDKHSIWSLASVANAVVEEQLSAPTGEVVIESEGDIQLVRNYDADRIQLRFPDKPSDEVRTLLKRNGFRWSPTWSSWQRQLNNRGEHFAKEVMKKLTTLATEALGEIE